MKILDHWQPVLKSNKLKNKPIEIEIASKKITLFRDKDNHVGAIISRCPHRGMNLSHGDIKDNNLVCTYHGWSFDKKGNGKSPCNPNMKIETNYFDIREYNDYIWLVKSGSQAKFPEFDIPNFKNITIFHRRAEAPLECVTDNFHEFEHFPRTHQSIGYDFKQIIESKIDINFFPDKIKLEFYPLQDLYWIVRKIFNLPNGSKYFMNIDVSFSPIFSIYQQGWINPTNNHKEAVLINVVFFVPINDNQTDIVMFLFTKKSTFSLIKDVFIKFASKSVINDDIKILNNLSDKQMKLQDMRLSQHDKAIIEIRKRIDEIYKT